MTLNNLPLLRILSTDGTALTLEPPGNPDATGAEGAFGSSLAAFLRAAGGELQALPVVARGGGALPAGGKDLPPAAAEGLPVPVLPGLPADAAAALEQAAELPADPAADALPAAIAMAGAAAAPEHEDLPARAPEGSGGGALPATAVSPLQVQAPGEPPMHTAGQVEAPRPPSASPHRPSPDGVAAALDRGLPRQPGVAALNKGIFPEPGVAGLDGEPRVAERRSTPGDNLNARSARPGAQHAVPAPAVRLQSDLALQSTNGEAIEGSAGKALAGQPGLSTLSAQASPAPLPAAAAAQPATAGPAPVPPATAAMPVSMPPIGVAPGADGFGEALGDRVIMMAGQRIQSADIRLNPAELGPLRVHVSVDDGTVSVNFHAQHAVTRDAIEQALPRLRELLGDNGLALGDASVSDQGAPRENADQGREPAPYASPPAADDAFARIADAGPSTSRRLAASSLVDLFA